MVLARVANIKSGWKSMFMVFTTAASDESPVIVRLAFETIEKIVREHFDYITETEVRPERRHVFEKMISGNQEVTEGKGLQLQAVWQITKG